MEIASRPARNDKRRPAPPAGIRGPWRSVHHPPPKFINPDATLVQPRQRPYRRMPQPAQHGIPAAASSRYRAVQPTRTTTSSRPPTPENNAAGNVASPSVQRSPDPGSKSWNPWHSDRSAWRTPRPTAARARVLPAAEFRPRPDVRSAAQWYRAIAAPEARPAFRQGCRDSPVPPPPAAPPCGGPAPAPNACSSDGSKGRCMRVILTDTGRNGCAPQPNNKESTAKNAKTVPHPPSDPDARRQ